MKVNILSRFEKNIRLYPDKQFLSFKGKSYSYKDAEKYIIDLEDMITTRFFSLPERIVLLSENNPEFIFVVIALWRLGIIPILISYNLKKKELQHCLNVSDSKYIFMIGTLIKYDLPKKYSIVSFPIKLKKTDKISNYKKFHNNEDAVILFTSGTTDKPKGVLLSFKNLESSAINSKSIIKQNSKTKWIASLPFYHIGGFSIITRSLMFGTEIIIPDDLKTEGISKALKSNPTHISLVPTQLKRLVESRIKPNKELKYVLAGGSKLDNDLLIDALHQGWKIYKVYGSTETSSMITALSYEDLYTKIDSVGSPFRNNEVKIFDEKFNELPAGKTGRVVIRSDSLMKEYIKDTKQPFIKDLFITNDIGFIDKDGYLFINGRADEIINSGGLKINPNEVEKILMKKFQFDEVKIIGVPDAEWGQKVVCFIQTNTHYEKTTIISFLKKNISNYKIPKEVILIKNIPRNSLGKIKSDSLLKIYNKMFSKKSS